MGVVALAMGSLVYLIERPANETYFIPESLSLFNKVTPLFGAIGNHLPTFSHAFALVLITAAVSSARRASYLFICGFWLLIDGFFELGQHTSISPLITSNVPAFVAELPILSHAINYFLNGRYDPIDMLSIVLGVIAAYGALLITEK